MKKILIVASVVLFAACDSKKEEKAETAKTGGEQTGQTINSPFPVSYSSNFVMGDPKHAEAILTLWKDWDAGNLSAHKEIFADSLELHFADGSMMSGVRDSMLAGGQQYRNTLTSSVSSVDAVMAVKSADKNENWALIWGKEIDKDQKGKVDSFYLQETWRFNKDGKANLMYQFKSAAAPPKN
ncbi:MAG TPA: hypothetical protein VK483_04880 [Chitinophagaceae bacterium]|nr:hypothetical protein [Chitinophagaceae bacterium]